MLVLRAISGPAPQRAQGQPINAAALVEVVFDLNGCFLINHPCHEEAVAVKKHSLWRLVTVIAEVERPLVNHRRLKQAALQLTQWNQLFSKTAGCV
jgi:G:T-mismatch repair DNA endonuclease (very short patch repair protein)